MYYYPHHIGDFIADTARLTDSQCMAYLRLIWHYYDTEKPLENDPESLAFKIGANTSDVNLILKHYFVLEGDVWKKTRCDNVIAEYHGKADKARKSAEARWKNATAKRTDSERNANASQDNANASKSDANQEPITNNQEPIVKELAQQVAEPEAPKKKKAEKVELDYSVWPQQPDKQILDDWIAMRKKKRGSFSQTVIDGFGEEFGKAIPFGYSVNDCLKAAIMSNWTGFKLSWLQNQNARGSQNGTQAKPSLIDRFIQNNYAGPSFKNDHGPMGGDDSFVRGEVVQPVRRDAGRIGPMEADIIGDFKATGGGCIE